jgi:hypothetical protein
LSARGRARLAESTPHLERSNHRGKWPGMT